MAELNLPPVLTIKRNEFEKAFKTAMTSMVSENKMEMDDLREINKHMVKWLITGMQNVDFKDDKQNQFNLDALVDDLWKKFYTDLNMQVRKYRTKFRRK